MWIPERISGRVEQQRGTGRTRRTACREAHSVLGCPLQQSQVALPSVFRLPTHHNDVGTGHRSQSHRFGVAVVIGDEHRQIAERSPIQTDRITEVGDLGVTVAAVNL